MKFDKPILTFDFKDPLDGKIAEITDFINADEVPVFIKNYGLDQWLKSRSIPKNKAFVHQIIESMNLENSSVKSIIDVTHGLSLTDVYWVKKCEDNIRWKDINLYENNFSEVLSLVAFTGVSSSVSGLSSTPELSTNGMLPKCWRREADGKIYLYKGCTTGFANSGKEPYSEFYASQLAEAMGLRHVTYGLKKWHGILCSTCLLVTSQKYSYVPIGVIMKDGGYRQAYDIYKKYGFADDFSSMVLFDSLIFNYDRHFGNFGFLINNDTDQYEKTFPLFDHGSGLFAYAMPDDLRDAEKLKKYMNGSKIYSGGPSFDEMTKTFCHSGQKKLLRPIFNFHFKRGGKYSYDDKVLETIETVIHDRARELYQMISD